MDKVKAIENIPTMRSYMMCDKMQQYFNDKNYYIARYID